MTHNTNAHNDNTKQERKEELSFKHTFSTTTHKASENMPYETVEEKVVRTRRIKICAHCQSRIPDSRQTYNMVGGVGGSLGAFLGGSILLGSALGPVGAIGGAIAGSIAGGRGAGRKASNKLADAVENQDKDSLCEACRSLLDNNNGGNDEYSHI